MNQMLNPYRHDRRADSLTQLLNAITVFRRNVSHFQVAIYPSDLLFHSDSRTRQSNPNCYKHIQTSKDAYKYSFYPRTIIQWNQLPSSVVTAETVESFKGILTVPVLIHVPILN